MKGIGEGGERERGKEDKEKRKEARKKKKRNFHKDGREMETYNGHHIHITHAN